MEGNVYATKGLSHQSAATLVENFDMDKQARLKQEKSFVITRQLTANEKELHKSLIMPMTCILPCLILNGS